MDELTIFPPVKWIFTVLNNESLPRLISQQPVSTTIIKASKFADAIPLTVEKSPTKQNTDCISFEIDGTQLERMKRLNQEVVGLEEKDQKAAYKMKIVSSMA